MTIAWRRAFPMLVVLTLACAVPATQASDEAAGDAGKSADIRGRVTHIEGSDVRVEETPEVFRGPKAVVKVTEQTAIRSASGRSLALADLREGQTVRVWYTGPVLKSYPLQVAAARIVVE